MIKNKYYYICIISILIIALCIFIYKVTSEEYFSNSITKFDVQNSIPKLKLQKHKKFIFSNRIKFSQIIDFTNIIDPINTNTVFNPSIAHWKDDLYIICYRTFKRFPRQLDDFSSFNIPSQSQKHPWYDPKWTRNEGIDSTAFCLVKINKEYNEYELKLVRTYENIFGIEGITIQDTRISSIPYKNNQFYITGNMFTSSDEFTFYNYKENNINSCKDSWCAIMVGCTLEIDPISGNLYPITQLNRLCENLSDKIEKNWVTFYDNNKLNLLYGLANMGVGHTRKFNDLLVINIDKNNTNNCKLYPQSNNILYPLDLLEYSYTKDGKQTVFISTSTPCISINNNTWISVGHIKYKYKDINHFPDSSLYYFNEWLTQEKFYFHWDYVYLMFFFIFQKYNNTYRIINISPFFITIPNKYSLVFPSGLERIPNTSTLIISYGDGDSYSKLGFINFENIPFINVNGNNINWKKWPVIPSNL